MKASIVHSKEWFPEGGFLLRGLPAPQYSGHKLAIPLFHPERKQREGLGTPQTTSHWELNGIDRMTKVLHRRKTSGDIPPHEYPQKTREDPLDM